MDRQTRYWSSSLSHRTSSGLTINMVRKTFAGRLASIITLGLISSVGNKTEKISRPHINVPARISLATQFERAAQVVSTTVTKSEAIQSLHAETVQKLDATEYALHRLFDEIHSVMPGFEKPVYGNVLVKVSESDAFRPEPLAA